MEGSAKRKKEAPNEIPSLPVSALRKNCDPEQLAALEAELKEPTHPGPVGQKRAVEALQFGLDVRYKGYNIFVMGPPGSGKTSITMQLIRSRAAEEARPDDLCYIYNFEEPHQPLPLQLPPGHGATLSRRIHQTIAGLARNIYQILNDEHFLARAAVVSAEAEQQSGMLLDQISEIAERHSLRIEMDGDQFVAVPLEDGEPIDSEVYDQLTPEQRDTIQERVTAFQEESAPILNAQHAQEMQAEEALMELEREAISGLVEETFKPLRKRFTKENKDLKPYFKGMKEYVLENYRDLIRPGYESSEEEEGPVIENPEDLPIPYQVNILVSHKSREGAPLEVEMEPIQTHLFGFMEYKESEEGLSADHMSLHAGALHRANGGYLILQAAELIRSPEAWQSLKRALRHREIRFHDFSLDPDKPRIYGSLRPKNTPMDQKLVLIGSVESYYRLMLEDEDFDRIFKIKAEFESWMPRDEEHELEFARFLRRVSEEEGFLPLHNSALARMIDEGSREVESQERMSTSITASLDLLCEADYWCRQEDRKEIRGEDIERALNGRESRHDSIARNIIESIEKGELLIDTDGWDVGQINGLLVYITQDHSFGVPTKITARTYAGKDGVINIDREAQLSGAIHDKSSMILVGLIGGLWGQNQPLHFNASITFEQLYGDIEGDSASCAEFYALLSSLSNTPIYQGIAVTGSINQQGLMQPIGSVNAKIEGMFKICKMRGLTGHQGVIIPEQNVNHLMLSDEVLEAVEAGTFHIWSIRHVYEGIDILMKSTMEPEENGTESKELVTLSEETKEIFGRVTDRINNFYDAAKEN